MSEEQSLADVTYCDEIWRDLASTYYVLHHATMDLLSQISDVRNNCRRRSWEWGRRRVAVNSPETRELLNTSIFKLEKYIAKYDLFIVVCEYRVNTISNGQCRSSYWIGARESEQWWSNGVESGVESESQSKYELFGKQKVGDGWRCWKCVGGGHI